MRNALLGLALCGAILVGACKRHPPPTGLALPAAPSSLPIQLGVEFDAAIELLGAQLEPASGLKPGSRVDLTLYWRKRDSIERGFRLFTHVLDEAGERILNLDDVGALRKVVAGEPVLPPSSWDENLVYVDRQTFTVPTSLRTDSFSIVAGLYRGQERLKVTRGKHQAERALVAQARVTRAVTNSALPQLWIPRRRPTTPVTIDGQLDEAAWVTAATTGQLVNVATGEGATGDLAGVVKLLYDDQSLYVGFEVFDEDLQGGFDPSQPDPQLWTRDTIELMIDPDGEGDNLDYYEIQVGPQNLVFDSQFDGYNRPKVEPGGPFGHQEWSAKLVSAVALRGTLDDKLEDEGYVVELSIPWSSFSKAKRLPPSHKDVWRMNFYAIQNNAGVAWSPILGQGNFHLASRFGRVRFSK